MHPHRSAAAALAACAALALAFVPPARGQVTRDAFWQPDGPVNATAYAGGVLYVGGNFTHVAPVTGALAGLDLASGHVIRPGRVAGRVNAIVPDGAGGWYVGGFFSSVQGVARSNLAQLDANGNVTPWNPGANSEVYALAFDSLHPNAVYASGAFTALGGQARAYLGAVDPVTGAARAWQPVLSADIGVPQVYALAVRAGFIYLGGNFSKVNGIYRFDAAVVDTFGTPTSFAPDVNGSVRAIAVRALVTTPFTVTVYLGGDFTRINGQTANHLGSVDGGTGVTNTFAADLDGSVNALTLTVSNFGAVTVWAGGAFTHANGSSRPYLASFTGAGALNAWNPGASDVVDALVYSSGNLYAGGKFLSAGGQPRHRLAALTTAGAATAWDPSPDSTVRVIGIGGGMLLAGGEFSSAGGIARHGLAALDAVTGQPTSWDPNPRGIVTGLLADGGNLFVGGVFDSIAGQHRSGVAQLVLSTGAATAWNPGASGPVKHFLVHKGLVYVAGAFNSLGQVGRAGLGAIDLQGNVAPWNPGFVGGSVFALAANSNTIFVGGNFIGISNDLSRDFATGLDDVTATVTSWNPCQFSGGVTRVDALALTGPWVWVGGNFFVMGNQQTYAFARVDTLSGFAIGQQPSTEPTGEVKSLLLDGTTLYVGGSFMSIGGKGGSNLAEVDVATDTVRAWNAQLRGDVQTLAAGSGSVFAGGLFQLGASSSAPNSQTRLEAASTTVTGVAPPGAGPPGAAIALTIAPNPARADMVLRFALPAPGALDAAVFDLAGRRVRVLAGGARALAGAQSLRWDGRDDTGARVAAGIYFVRVRAGATELTAKALRLD